MRGRFAGGIALLVLALLLGSAGGAAGARSRPLRPNLVPLAPQSFFSPDTGGDPTYIFGGAFVVDGCTLDEVARKLARRCLRFDTALANIGTGPLEVAYLADPAHPALAAHQRTYRSDGTYRSRFAVDTEYHPTHAHFHIKDMYVARMWRATRRGRPLGDKALTQSDKNGFCPQDSSPVMPDPDPARYQCFGAEGTGSDGAVQVVGISSGWADIYDSSLPDQYVEISGLRDGPYLFELEIDPHDVFVESSEGDNRVCVLVQLQGKNASPLGERRCP